MNWVIGQLVPSTTLYYVIKVDIFDWLAHRIASTNMISAGKW